MAANNVIGAYALEIGTFLQEHYNDFLMFIGNEEDVNHIIDAFKELEKEDNNDNAR